MVILNYLIKYIYNDNRETKENSFPGYHFYGLFHFPREGVIFPSGGKKK